MAWVVFTKVCFRLYSDIIAMHVSQLGEGEDPTVSCVKAWKGKIDVYEVVGKRSWPRLTYSLRLHFFSWLYPFVLNKLYHKTSFPRSGSSWWPKEALEAWQPLAPGLVSPAPVRTGCTQLAASPAYVLPPVKADGNGQLFLLPAWRTCCPCTSPKLCAIIPLFAFHLHEICLLMCPGGGFYPTEQENDCMCSCSSYNLGHCFPSSTNQCSLPKCQPKGT